MEFLDFMVPLMWVLVGLVGTALTLAIMAVIVVVWILKDIGSDKDDD